MAALSLMVRLAPALLLVLVTGCGAPEAAPFSGVQKVLAHVRGIT
jgi:hypothetical protein